MSTRKMIVMTGSAAVLLGAVLFVIYNAAATTNLKWVGCGISKTAFMAPLADAYEKKTGVRIEVSGGGATRGIVDVASGQADMGGTCRHLLLRPEERGVKLVPVGWDALVVIVHPGNRVKNLSLDQLKEIYTGKITNWKQVGGADQHILVVARAGKISGVGRMFRELVFQKPDQEFTSSAKIVTESAGVEKTVETDKGAIAVTGISSALKRRVVMIGINGKTPARANIVNGSYLLYRPLYLVEQVQASDDVKRFIAFAISDEGQAIIRKEGTVSLKEGSRLWGLYTEEMEQAGVVRGSY